MTGQPAISARLLGRGFALLGGFFLLVFAGNCGRQTFDLLAPDASAPGVGGAGTGGDTGAGTGGDTGAGLGADDSGVDTAGGRPATGHGAPGRAGDGGRASGGSSGSNDSLAGDAQGGSDEPCLPGQSCVDGGVSCPPTANNCKRCQVDAECGHNAPPYCDTADGRCVECLPNRSDCRLGESCDPIFFRCARACQATQADCAQNHQYCSVSRGVCVDCVFPSDCADVAGHANYHCAAGFCVECSDDGECTDPARPKCQRLHCVAKP